MSASFTGVEVRVVDGFGGLLAAVVEVLVVLLVDVVEVVVFSLSQATPSPSRSSFGLYPFSPRFSGVLPASSASWQFWNIAAAGASEECSFSDFSLEAVLSVSCFWEVEFSVFAAGVGAVEVSGVGRVPAPTRKLATVAATMRPHRRFTGAGMS